METIAALPTGTKLILAAGGLLFFDLFFTWQSMEQRFNKKYTFTQNLDGFDAWGLLLLLLTLGILAITVIRLTSLELSPEVPWNRIVLALGGLTFVAALVKNVLDEESALASYVGVVLAAAVAAGAYLDRDRPEPVRAEKSYRDEWTPRVRAVPEPPEHNGRPTTPTAVEPRPAPSQQAESSKRW